MGLCVCVSLCICLFVSCGEAPDKRDCSRMKLSRASGVGQGVGWGAFWAEGWWHTPK